MLKEYLLMKVQDRVCSIMSYNINYVAFKQVGVKTSKHLGTRFILYGLFWKVPQEMSRHVLENQVEI